MTEPDEGRRPRVGGTELLDAAVAALRAGGLVAFPTETVYGLGADAADPGAVRHLFAVKGRPATHPVIVHLPGVEALESWAVDVPDGAHALAEAFWPGPLTLVLRRKADVPDEVTGGRGSVGLRVPDQPLALALLRAFGGGLAAPSANRFGRVSPTSAPDVVDELDGDVDVVLDGGPCRVGVESTIVDLSGAGPELLRPGGVPVEQVEAHLGQPVARHAGGPSRAPGMLPSHYAPRARVEVVTAADLPHRARALVSDGLRVAVLAEARLRLPDGTLALDPVGDVEGYARWLYRRLRDADDAHIDVVLAVPPAETGLGRAVVDRLRKAAGPRP